MRHEIVGLVVFHGNYCSTSVCQISSRFWRFHRRNFQLWQTCFRFCSDGRNGRSSQQRITRRYVLISSRFSRTSSRAGRRSFRKVVKRERYVALTDKAPAVHLEEGDGSGGQGQAQVQQLAKLKHKSSECQKQNNLRFKVNSALYVNRPWWPIGQSRSFTQVAKSYSRHVCIWYHCHYY